MRYTLSAYIGFFFIFIAIPSLMLAQLSWKLNLGGGYYTSQGAAQLNNKDFLLQLDGDLGYLYKKKNKMLAFAVRVRPELYGFSNQFKVLKFRGKGSYLHKGNTYDWGIHFVNHRFVYSGLSIEQKYNNLLLQSNLQWFRDPRTYYNISAAYAYQSTDYYGDLHLDLIFLDGTRYKMHNRYFKVGYGLYLERFYIKHDMNLSYTFEKKSNSGWRVGPLISINYLKNFYIKFDYRFLFHFSEMTNYPSYEQRVRLVTGIIFFTDWSLFIIADYYTRNLTHKESEPEQVALLYTPINLENRIYLKVSYNLENDIELYSKFGYFKENLFYYDQNLNGWSGVIGIEISK
jgi:hypothetical protein